MWDEDTRIGGTGSKGSEAGGGTYCKNTKITD